MEGVILESEDGRHLVFWYEEVEESMLRLPRDNELKAAWEDWIGGEKYEVGSCGCFEEDFIDNFLPGVELSEEDVSELSDYVYERCFDLGYVDEVEG